MSLLQKLKSLLGFGDTASERRYDRDVGVTVERERDEPDERSADTDSGAPPMDESEDGPEHDDDPPEADAAEHTGPDGAPETDAADVDEPDEAPEIDTADAPSTAGEGGQSVDSVPVGEIKGIGPAYSDRLAAAGVETVSDLAAADAADLAEGTDISEKRLQGWIDRAQVR